jgi:hypothetical protein
VQQRDVNPYDRGFRRNWRQFLGLERNRSWLSVVLSSWHAPVGDDTVWREGLPISA